MPEGTILYYYEGVQRMSRRTTEFGVKSIAVISLDDSNVFIL